MYLLGEIMTTIKINIQISKEIQLWLLSQKLVEAESYNSVLQRIRAQIDKRGTI